MAATTEWTLSSPGSGKAIALSFPDKRSGSTVLAAVDFTNRIPSGASISSSDAWAATVKSGTDSSPSSVLSGSASTSGTTCQQKLTAGTDGVEYYIVAQVTLSDSQVLEQLCVLKVEDLES